MENNIKDIKCKTDFKKSKEIREDIILKLGELKNYDLNYLYGYIKGRVIYEGDSNENKSEPKYLHKQIKELEDKTK